MGRKTVEMFAIGYIITERMEVRVKRTSFSSHLVHDPSLVLA